MNNILELTPNDFNGNSLNKKYNKIKFLTNYNYNLNQVKAHNK